jgi:hypothetical protein
VTLVTLLPLSYCHVRTLPTQSPLLDRFIPDAAVQGRHETVVRAPAPLVLETARMFDLRSMLLVRAIFWLRAKILGAKAAATDWSSGFVQELLGMGWGILAEKRNRWFVAGAVCRPWLADVIFTPIPLSHFAAYSEPDQVKIIWTLEVEPLGEARSRFATETRAVATDAQAQAKFRR